MRSELFKNRIQDPRRQRALSVREAVESGITRFFQERGFRKVRTPLLVRSPGMETHIRPFQALALGQKPASDSAYLATSPEFAMKKLLAGGYEKIFQICPAFRAEPFSRTHHPEFTLLEFYRAHVGYEAIMKDTEALVEFLAQSLSGHSELRYQGQTISVKTPWPRLRVRDLFLEHTDVDLVRCSERSDLEKQCARLKIPTDARDTWDDLYFKIWLNEVEPKLPKDRAVFVTRYPASQSALAVTDRDPDGSTWARRFEFYIGGLELGNAFEELTDAKEQRLRFETDMKLREKTYGASFPKSPIDEEFLEAVAQMPSAGGIAIGVDRLVMLFADEADIGFTTWLPPYGGSLSENDTKP